LIGRALCALTLWACSGTTPPVAPPPKAPVEPPVARAAGVLLESLESWRARRPKVPAIKYLKGALHVHTKHSGDSTTWPKQVIRYYDRAGFDFVVITDHNRVTELVPSELAGTDILVFPGIELTNNPPRCTPAPVEEKGRCRIHVNGLFLRDFSSHSPDERPIRHHWRERKSIARVDLYTAAIRFARERDGLIMINHPTWFWGTDGALLTELGRRGIGLVEIANVAFAPWNAGAAPHPGTEAIWDAALSAGVKMWGVASDDAHHYRQSEIDKRELEGKAIYPAFGGFVMVRARPTMRAIRAAVERGDFYSSTGVLLERADVEGTELVVEVAPSERRGHTIEVIGDGGKVIERLAGRSLRFALSRVKTYARVRVTAADGARAWTQPVFIEPPVFPSPPPGQSQTR